jgi:NodT family efflux transporter outer membrane factor (OMF) lipoprotein
MIMHKKSLRLLPLAAVLILSACAAGPDYKRPTLDLPAAYAADAGWKTAVPRDTEARGKWWEVYGDATLNALVEQVQANNQGVVQAEANYRQARALAQEARAGFFPAITATANASRNHSSTTTSGMTTTGTADTHSIALDASWEPDIWGKVRRANESGNAAEQASAGDLAAAALSAQAELVQDYFQLRVTDAEIALLDTTITAYQRASQITQNQYAAGIITRADVASAQTQLQSTQSQVLALGIQRATLEHAMAVLVGKAPGQVTVAPAPLQATLPAIPAAGLPSDLLERRPDIAAAERRVAAANAGIGVARSAFYPALTLTGSIGRQGNGFSQWFDAPTTVWSLGAGLAQTLFEGGLRKAASAAATASYDATVAQYKQTVLGGLQEVEDNLATLRVLEQQATVQDAATRSSEDAATLVMNQYKAGIVSYLNVVVAQSTALANERSSLQLRGQQLSAHVLLIKALGGAPVVHKDGAPQKG